MREILNCIVDMHVHNGPSNANRKFDTGEFCIEADKAGYKAFITKDHYFPSVMTANDFYPMAGLWKFFIK